MRTIIGLTAAWVAASPFVWAQAPLSPEERQERRIERREAIADDLRREVREGENINVPGANINIPPAASNQGISVQAPGTNVQVPPPGSGVAPTVETPATNIEPNATASPTNANPAVREDWRYRRHDGRWWYWQPNNSWVYWSGSTWVPFSGPRYSTGYRGDGQSSANSNSDSYNYYQRRGLLRNRAYSYPAPQTNYYRGAPATIPNNSTPDNASAVQGGGGQATGGPIGSPQERGSIIGGGAAAGQGSGVRARDNLGTFGTPGGQVGGHINIPGGGGATNNGLNSGGVGPGGQLNLNTTNPPGAAPGQTGAGLNPPNPTSGAVPTTAPTNLGAGSPGAAPGGTGGLGAGSGAGGTGPVGGGAGAAGGAGGAGGAGSGGGSGK